MLISAIVLLIATWAIRNRVRGLPTFARPTDIDRPELARSSFAVESDPANYHSPVTLERGSLPLCPCISLIGPDPHGRKVARRETMRMWSDKDREKHKAYDGKVPESANGKPRS